MSVTPEEMRAAVTTPVFQPNRGETGRAWMAKEYGVTMDTSSLMSSETERDDTDDEMCSFDLGPEPYDPNNKARLPSDEWLDDHQQGLQPVSSEPRYDSYDRYLAMLIQLFILDMMRSEMETSELSKPPPPPERYAGTDTSPGPSTCGATSRGPRILDVSTDQTQSLQHHAPHQNWNVRPDGVPPTMGRGHESPRRPVGISGR